MKVTPNSKPGNKNLNNRVLKMFLKGKRKKKNPPTMQPRQRPMFLSGSTLHEDYMSKVRPHIVVLKGPLGISVSIRILGQ